MASSVPRSSQTTSKQLILFAQEVACLQRPVYTAVWAASLHAVWYYLSFTTQTFLATCCTVGLATLSLDFTLHYCDILSDLTLLPETLARENGKPTPSVLEFMESPRTYEELNAELAHGKEWARTVSTYMIDFRQRDRFNFTIAIAVGSIVLGAFLSEISGATISYLAVLFILLFPIVERTKIIRVSLAKCVTSISPHYHAVKEYFASNRKATVSPLPSDADTAHVLQDKLPSMENVARAVSHQSSATSLADEQTMAALSEHFSKSTNPALPVLERPVGGHSPLTALLNAVLPDPGANTSNPAACPTSAPAKSTTPATVPWAAPATSDITAAAAVERSVVGYVWRLSHAVE